jgi:hypothetical protein
VRQEEVSSEIVTYAISAMRTTLGAASGLFVTAANTSAAAFSTSNAANA